MVACFVWSTLFSWLIVLLFVITAIMYQSESYVVANAVQLRKRIDIYQNELVDPAVKLMKIGYLLKMALSLLCYAYIEGSTRTISTDLLIAIPVGFEMGLSLYGPIAV